MLNNINIVFYMKSNKQVIPLQKQITYFQK